MADACEKCPCPAICFRRAAWCDWAKREPQNPVEIRSICERSARGEKPAPVYPSLSRQLATAAWAVGRVIEAVATGQPVLVPIEKQQERLAICRACEFLDVEQARCTRCGCHLPGITGKTALATEACPIGKW